MNNLENFDNKRAKALEWWRNLNPERMVLCTVWEYEAHNYQFKTTFNMRTNVELTTKPQMGYSTC